MRIRSIKPEFWRSDDVDALDVFDRLLFIGLWSYVDDNGVGRDRASDVAADLFSGDLSRHPRDTLARVAAGLQHLAVAGLVTRYSVGSKGYLYVASWATHQRIDRPAKARYPLPTCDDAVPRETVATPSRQSRDTPAPGAVEQGNRGTGEQGEQTPSTASRTRPPTPARSTPITAEHFAAFYDAYPRHVGRRDAETAFRAACRQAPPERIIAGARRFAADPNLPEPQYRPHPATWLRRGGWDDEPLPVRAPQIVNGRPGPDERFANTLELGRRLQAVVDGGGHLPEIGA